MDSLIRIGTVNDLPQVLNLIKDLAAFENEPNEVEVTITEMQNWGFVLFESNNYLLEYYII